MRWLILACCIAGCASFGNLPPPQASRGVGAWPASSSRVGRPEQNGRGLGRMIMCKAHGVSEDAFGIIPVAGPSAGQGQMGFRRVGGGEARAGGRTAMGMSGNMRRAEEWRKRGDRRWQVENEKRLTGRGLIPIEKSLATCTRSLSISLSLCLSVCSVFLSLSFPPSQSVCIRCQHSLAHQ